MEFKELLIVACHAIFVGNSRNDIYDDNKWILFPFQKGEPKYYVEHLKEGIKLLSEKENSILIISGGKTRQEALNLSEAVSYYNIAELENWFGFVNVKERTFLEEYARDSFENLLFSICRYYQLFKSMPEKNILITWKFKEERYDFHRKSIGIEDYEYEFIGVNEPDDLNLAIENERKTLSEFKSDPYGIKGTLREKKELRNPLKLVHPYICNRFIEILDKLKF